MNLVYVTWCFCFEQAKKNASRLTFEWFPFLYRVSRCPWLSEHISSVIPIYIAVIFLFTLANFCMATFMDPGVFPRGKHITCKLPAERPVVPSEG